MFLLSILSILLFSAGDHGDLHERIIQVTSELEAHPDSSYLYYKRGKLFYEHEVFDSSIIDMYQAIHKGEKNGAPQYYISKANIKLVNPAKAQSSLNEAKTLFKNQSAIAAVQAEIYDLEKEYLLAAKEWEFVISNTRNLRPEHYIKAHEMYLKSSCETCREHSISILVKGLTDLGQISSMHILLVEAYVLSQRLDDAIKCQMIWTQQLQRKEHAFVKLAELYLLAGRKIEGKNSFQKAKIAINKLTPRAKKTQAIADLSSLIHQKLSEL